MIPNSELYIALMAQGQRTSVLFICELRNQSLLIAGGGGLVGRFILMGGGGGERKGHLICGRTKVEFIRN